MGELEWIDESHFRVQGVDFVSWHAPDRDPSDLLVCKPRAMVDDYERALHPPISNIVEVGIYGGGSTALLAMLCQPRRLVSIELSTRPVDNLAQFVEEHGLQDVVRPCFGVDQADRTRVAAIVDEQFGGEPLDLVIDDASHQLAPSRATFTELFPRLRPGGRYIIEDWSGDTRTYQAAMTEFTGPGASGPVLDTSRVTAAADDPSHPLHTVANLLRERLQDGTITPEAVSEPNALPRLVLELVMAKACRLPGIGDLEITDYWVVVTRSDAPLHPDTFRVDDPELDPGELVRRAR